MKKNLRDLLVLISDVHFNVKTLELAKASLRAAFAEARQRKLKLCIAGDLNDTKAIMRAECVNAILEIFKEFPEVVVFILVGNHDLINEKGSAHSLNFLKDYATVIEQGTAEYIPDIDVWMVAYHHDKQQLMCVLAEIPDEAIVIMHQGVLGAEMGEYVVDKSSISPELLNRFKKVNTGHYHKNQIIGAAEFIGTPYSVTAAEAQDGPKGIQIMNTEGDMTQVPLGLRKHVTVERTFETVMDPIPGLNSNDILWIKVKGPGSELDKIKKKDVGMHHLGHANFKLEPVPDEADEFELPEEEVSEDVIFDRMIDASEETPDQKLYLKTLWRDQCE